MAEALLLSSENCTVARTLATIGEKWTLLVLRDAFLGVRRFDDFRRRTGAPRQVLSERLSRLVDEGIMRRLPYREPGQRPRLEYRFTQRGLDLYPVLLALIDYGDKYHADPEGPPVLIRHRDCGAAIHAVLRCDAGHDVESARQAYAVPGPSGRSAAVG